MDRIHAVNEQLTEQAALTIEIMTLQECECMINKLSWSFARRLEFDDLEYRS